MTVTTKVVTGKECVPDPKYPELGQITFLIYPNEVNCMLKGLERPGIESGTSNLNITRPSGGSVATKVVKGKECVPDLTNPKLDQITFLLYPREVNCTLKGLERPGIDSGMPFWMSHVRLRCRSRQGCQGGRMRSRPPRPLSPTKLVSYGIEGKEIAWWMDRCVETRIVHS